MKFRHALILAAISLAAAGGPAFAQSVQENSDADALAADMRLLAANPVDIEALIKAGEITLRMGDTTASATFYGRAERLDPLNPRIKAGLASLVLRAERPGEALRRFREAETRGLDPRKFAADRGLAYDLIGEQERAQRDYRLALQAGPDDEVTRRYALSLGISGRGAEAMKLLDPLLRRSDRAAWRDRAFILAMTGDQAGAQKIANSMMSPGLGAGLAPFFQRLPQLTPADRAYAVTFGELLSSPARAADARLAPPMAKLGPDPTAPRVMVAAAAPVKEPKEDKGKKRKKDRDADKGLAPAVAPPVEVAAALPPPPPARSVPAPVPMVQPLPTATRIAALPPKKTAERPIVKAETRPLPPVVAKTETKPVPPVKVETGPEPQVAETKPELVRTEPKPVPAPATSAPVDVAARPAATASAGVEIAAVTSAPVPQGTTPPVIVTPPASSAVAEPTAPQAGVADQPSAAEAGVSRTSAVAKVSEDSILARIIAGIDVPGSELGVTPPPVKASPPPAPKSVPPAAEFKPEPKPAKPVPDAKSQPGTTKPVAAADTKSRSAKAKAELADPAAKATKARGKGQSADEDADMVGCLTPDSQSRTGARGRSTSLSARGRSAARGKADTNCKATNTRAKGQLADQGDDDTVDCLTADSKSRTANRGKSAATTTRGRSAAARGKLDANCKAASNTKTKGRNANDDTDAIDCAKPDAKGRGATRRAALAKGKADTRCTASDKKSDTVSTKGESARIWVQVAGGANEASLQKAWAGVKAKAPDLFRGRQGWSTPLRATNRVLTGPFKSSDEAQEFVNKLSKAGLSGFVFTSTKGQKVDRLP